MNPGPTEKPKIVALGGGEGLHRLLEGLVKRSADVSAILTVADDGGSSGRIRKDFDIPPPGDIRKCLVALSGADPIIGELFEHRFQGTILKDHSFGNLFIGVLAQLSGDFRGAISKASEILGVQGRVIPSTDRKVVLVAEHDDGTKSTGQEAIANSKKSIRDVSLLPRPPLVSREIRDVLREADLICIGPGSLFTRIAPNLLVPGMIECINAASAPVVYVANLMTQPGETDGFGLKEHLAVLASMNPPLKVDSILIPAETISQESLTKFRQEGDDVVEALLDDVDFGGELRPRSLVASGEKVRHDPHRLAEAILEFLPGGAPKSGHLEVND